jgi:hypothetical protein
MAGHAVAATAAAAGVPQVGFEELAKWALSNPDPQDDMVSGRQELAEIYLDMHIR